MKVCSPSDLHENVDTLGMGEGHGTVGVVGDGWCGCGGKIAYVCKFQEKELFWINEVECV